MKTLSLENPGTPQAVFYLKEMLEEGLRVDSTRSVYDALSRLSRYYYSHPVGDSLAYWVSFTDSIVNRKKDNPDVYYFVHGLISKMYNYQGFYDLSITEVVRMQNRAKETGQVYGEICSLEALGVIYQNSNRDSMAVASFREALDRLERIDGDLEYRICLISRLVRSYLKMNDPANTGPLLKKYESLVDLQDEINSRLGIVDPISWYRRILYSYSVGYYLQKNQMNKAKQALDRMISYSGNMNPSSNFDYSNYYYYYAQACYYQKTKEYDKAHAALDTILASSEELEILQLKIDLLVDQENYDEMMRLYEKSYRITEERSDDLFFRQVNQLRTAFDVNDKELKDRELKLVNIEVDRKRNQLILSVFVLWVLMFLMFLFYKILKHSRRLRYELQEEKALLVESEGKLIRAKEIAETANEKKNAFVANISHEIRTPLNAIVGFSTLLADPGYDKDSQNEFIKLINENSEILLNLINDVLQLSRLEAGSLKLELKPCELNALCKEVLDNVEHRVNEGVRLTYAGIPDSFILHTDSIHFKYVLLNLLTNSAKFTEKGEINLSFTPHLDKQELHIVVTDTGCGIPLDKQRRIFDHFEKLDEYAQGTGLGLSICKIVASRLGGSIYVDPAYTTGSRFVFVHPYTFPHEKN